MLEQLAADYLEHLTTLHRRPATLLLAETALRDFRGLLGHDRQPSPADVEAYRLYLKRSGLAEASIYNRFRNVFKWLAWAVARGHLLQNPADGFKDKAPFKMTRFIPTEAEMARLLTTPPGNRYSMWPRDEIALEILYGAGLRRMELCSLDLHDYQRQPPALLVRAGKGQVDRLVPIGDHLQALLESYLATTRPNLTPAADEPALLLTREGKRITPGTLQAITKQHARRAGLPKLSIHSLRHAYASHLLAGGASLYEVQLLLGHRRLKTTEIYTHLNPRDLVREYYRTHPRARRRSR